MNQSIKEWLDTLIKQGFIKRWEAHIDNEKKFTIEFN